MKLGPHDGPYIEVNGTPRLVNDSAILAADASVAHLAAQRVLSIAESREGIAHLRVLMKDAPVDVAHVANAVEKEFLLQGVGETSRRGWTSGPVDCKWVTCGADAADAAKIFQASTRRRTSARNLRSPNASAVTTMIASLCFRHRAILSSASLDRRGASKRVATSSIVGSLTRGTSILWMA